MKRSASISLVLLGTGITLSACGESAAARACREARAEGRIDAAQICARAEASSRGGGGHYYGSAWYYGAGSGNPRVASAATTSRGGFGARGASGG